MTPSLVAVARDALRGGREHRYAGHPQGVAELHLPRGPGPHPVAVVVHGGSWSRGISKLVMRPVCRDLVRRGWAAWNVEYRRLGGDQGGGWPATFADLGAAIDHLALVRAPLDLGRVVLVGHSAGGHLALWAAGRETLPDTAPGSQPQVRPAGVIAQAPVADIERERSLIAPGGLITALLGGTPQQVPQRYEVANPIRRVPLGVPAVLVHGPGDRTVRIGHSTSYLEAAAAAGAAVELIEVPDAGHRSHVDPRSRAWRAAAERLEALAAVPA